MLSTSVVLLSFTLSSLILHHLLSFAFLLLFSLFTSTTEAAFDVELAGLLSFACCTSSLGADVGAGSCSRFGLLKLEKELLEERLDDDGEGSGAERSEAESVLKLGVAAPSLFASNFGLCAALGFGLPLTLYTPSAPKL